MPRIIQIKTLTTFANGLKRDILPNASTNPKGSASIKVKINIRQFTPKPDNNLSVTSQNIISQGRRVDRIFQQVLLCNHSF